MRDRVDMHPDAASDLALDRLIADREGKAMLRACRLATPPRDRGEGPTGWRPMSTAPRDGTIVEIRCDAGVASWYSLYKWADKMLIKLSHWDHDGSLLNTEIMESACDPCWVDVTRPGHCFEAKDEDSRSWRPYRWSTPGYVDPTRGAQESLQYWRDASIRGQVVAHPRAEPDSATAAGAPATGVRRAAPEQTPARLRWLAALFVGCAVSIGATLAAIAAALMRMLG